MFLKAKEHQKSDLKPHSIDLFCLARQGSCVNVAFLLNGHSGGFWIFGKVEVIFCNGKISCLHSCFVKNLPQPNMYIEAMVNKYVRKYSGYTWAGFRNQSTVSHTSPVEPEDMRNQHPIKLDMTEE